MKKYNKIVFKEKNLLSLIIFILVCLFCLWAYPDLSLKMGPDSWGYINVAKDFSHPSHEIRPFFYPLIIRISMILSIDHWENILFLIQIVLHSSFVVLLFHIYIKCDLSTYISFLLSLGIGFNPNLIWWSTYILTDHIFGIMIGLTWMSLIMFSYYQFTNI